MTRSPRSRTLSRRTAPPRNRRGASRRRARACRASPRCGRLSTPLLPSPRARASCSSPGWRRRVTTCRRAGRVCRVRGRRRRLRAAPTLRLLIALALVALVIGLAMLYAGHASGSRDVGARRGAPGATGQGRHRPRCSRGRRARLTSSAISAMLSRVFPIFSAARGRVGNARRSPLARAARRQ